MKCKRPIKGHLKPTGVNCNFETVTNAAEIQDDVSANSQRVQPVKKSYFDVDNRKMLVCACCGRLSPGKSSEEIHLYSTVSHTSNYHGNYNFLKRMLLRLKYCERVPNGVRLCYDLHHRLGIRFKKLSSIPLDYRGVVYNGSQCDVVVRFLF